MFDDLIGKIFSDNEERRALYGAFLAETEERLSRAEADVLTAYEAGAEGIGLALADAERLRGEVNTLWAEIEKPAPDWSLFNAAAIK